MRKQLEVCWTVAEARCFWRQQVQGQMDKQQLAAERGAAERSFPEAEAPLARQLAVAVDELAAAAQSAGATAHLEAKAASI